ADRLVAVGRAAVGELDALAAVVRDDVALARAGPADDVVGRAVVDVDPVRYLAVALAAARPDRQAIRGQAYQVAVDHVVVGLLVVGREPVRRVARDHVSARRVGATHGGIAGTQGD